MRQERKNPVAAGRAADRACVGVDCGSADNRDTNHQLDESLAVIIFAKRLGLTITHSRIVCQLAGIGGRDE